MIWKPSGSRRVVSTVLSAAVLFVLMTFTSTIALGAGSGGITERVSLGDGSPGAQATGSSYGPPAVSANGRYVAFASDASNLVAGGTDTNGVKDVFVRDRVLGTTERVSVGVGNAQGIGPSDQPSISADGQFVAFRSYSQLVPTPALATINVYVRDRQLGTTQLVSVAPGNGSPNSDSYEPAISADGKKVAFTSNAYNLVPSDNNYASDVFVCDLLTKTISRVSLSSTGAEWASGESDQPSISGDGRYVAYRHQYVDTSGGIANNFWEVWLRDTVAPASKRLSVTALAPATGVVNGDSYNPAISQDGAYVAFDTAATNLSGYGGTQHAIMRVNTSGGVLGIMVSQDTNNNNGNGISDTPAISGDGRFVAFRSDSTNLTPGDNNGLADIFLRDCTKPATTIASVATAGTQGNGDSFSPAISSDGSVITFASSASNLVTSGDTNGVDDIFARLIDSTPPVTTLQASPAANAQGWWNGNVVVTLTAADNAGSGVVSTSYTVNGGATQAYSSPFSVTAEGTTPIAYFSTDAAGNVEAPAKATSIKIDKTPPAIAFNAAPGSTHPAPFAVTATPSDTMSGIDTTRDVEMSADGGAWVRGGSMPLTAATHTISARSWDKAGNQSAATSVTFQVTSSGSTDVTAPHTTLAWSAPAASTDWRNRASAQPSLTATDDVSGVQSTSWRINSGSPSAMTTSPPELLVAWPALAAVPWADGPNTLQYFSLDAQGNQETTVSVPFHFDNTPPTITFDAKAVYTGAAVVNATPIDPLSRVNPALNRIKVDSSGTWVSGTQITVPAGVHTVWAEATDNAGNVRLEHSIQVTVPATSYMPVYRFRNLKNGYYLYSADPAERANINATLFRTWKEEGVAYSINVASADNQSPLWRFRNLKNGCYLYSANPAERANINATLFGTWKEEGVAYNVSRNPVGTAPVWRFRNIKNGTYLLSANPAEKASIVANLSKVWHLEGAAFYVAP